MRKRSGVIIEIFDEKIIKNRNNTLIYKILKGTECFGLIYSDAGGRATA
jgi:hypothetical protein